MPVGVLSDLVREILIRVGLPDADAALGAAAIVQADSWGVSTHGSALLPAYVRRLRAGLMNPEPNVAIAGGGSSTLIVDGDNGLGQVVASRAMDWTIAAAKQAGLAAATIRNSNHFGAAGVYAVQAADAGMIGIVASNGAPVMAPWGAARPYLSTNPLAIAVGTGESGPVVLDMASSAISRSMVSRLASNGARLPGGVALDAHGRPTEDPTAALAGALLPAAGTKGSALALIIEILSGVLSDGTPTDQIKELHGDLSGPQGTSHFMLALDVASFGDADGFARRLQQFGGAIRRLPPADGFDRVIVPGDEKTAQQRSADNAGVELTPASRAALGDLVAELGIEPVAEIAALLDWTESRSRYGD